MATIYNSQLDAFATYHLVQQESNSSSETTSAILRALSDGFSGSAGASISNVVTYPLDLIITRLQIQRQLRKDASTPSDKEYKGFVDAAKKILDAEGWKGFYVGLLSDTGKTILDSFLFFLMYDFMRKRRLRKGGQIRKSLPAAEELGVGFIAGSLTKLVTTPVANVVTRQQAAAMTDSEASNVEIAQQIMNESGVAGFWSGYSASLVLTLNPSLTFFLFETFKKILVPASKRENPHPATTFVLAAISKACASSVTYPFSLAKSRLQAGNLNKEDNDEKEVVDKEVRGSKKKRAARTTVFSTLLTIVKHEGVPALYEGLHLEIIKAFFSHGTTMLVKQVVSRILVRAYYILSVVWTSLQRKLRISRLAEKAKGSSVEYYDLAIKRSNDKISEVKKVAAEKAKEAAEFVAEYVDDSEDLGDPSGLARWLDQRGR